jgi:hypothetical protein
MDGHEFYFLVMVCAAFGIFAVVLGANYIQYRNWLKHEPHAADD